LSIALFTLNLTIYDNWFSVNWNRSLRFVMWRIGISLNDCVRPVSLRFMDNRFGIADELYRRASTGFLSESVQLTILE